MARRHKLFFVLSNINQAIGCPNFSTLGLHRPYIEDASPILGKFLVVSRTNLPAQSQEGYQANGK
jgi:hypothetical protein